MWIFFQHAWPSYWRFPCGGIVNWATTVDFSYNTALSIASNVAYDLNAHWNQLERLFKNMFIWPPTYRIVSIFFFTSSTSYSYAAGLTTSQNVHALGQVQCHTVLDRWVIEAQILSKVHVSHLMVVQGRESILSSLDKDDKDVVYVHFPSFHQDCANPSNQLANDSFNKVLAVILRNGHCTRKSSLLCVSSIRKCIFFHIVTSQEWDRD